MSKWIKILLGLILLVVPFYLIFPGMLLSDWGQAAWELIKGGITLGVLFIGLVLIIIGISELKE
jgi:uncharacterized membrane protein